MALLYPTIYFDRIYDIDFETLQKLGVNSLLLDVDNTLTIDKGTAPDPRTVEWIEQMRNLGVKMMIVSNGKSHRLKQFSKKLNLDCFAMAFKPLPFKLKKAVKLISNDKNSVLMIGDQIFTDILGGNTVGINTALLNPIETEKTLSFKIRRHFEKGIRQKLKKGTSL